MGSKQDFEEVGNQMYFTFNNTYLLNKIFKFPPTIFFEVH